MSVEVALNDIIAQLDRIEKALNILLRAHGRAPDGTFLPIPAAVEVTSESRLSQSEKWPGEK